MARILIQALGGSNEEKGMFHFGNWRRWWKEEMIDGLSERVTSGHVPVLRLHYSADPKKRPGTPDGDIWIDQASQGYPGGTASPRWRKEMEIDYGALGGTRLFPSWEQWTAQHPILLPAGFQPHGYRLYGSYDHGWRRPAAFHVHAVNGDGDIVTVWEMYADKMPIPQVAKIILGESVLVPRREEATIDSQKLRFEGNPFAGQLAFIVADPQIWAEDQPMSENTFKSVAALFRRCGVLFTKGEKGGDSMVAQWLHGHYWRDLANPRYRIAANCTWLIWELGRLRHQDYSPHVALTKDQPEKLVDKDDHAWDGLKMFLKRFPPKAMQGVMDEAPNTFQWWRKVARMQKDGQPIPTYVRET